MRTLMSLSSEFVTAYFEIVALKTAILMGIIILVIIGVRIYNWLTNKDSDA